MKGFIMEDSFYTCIPYELDEKETDIEVFYSFSPAEERTWDYPGCFASAEVHAIEPRYRGESISDLAVTAMLDEEGEYYKDLCDRALEEHEDRDWAAKCAAEDAAFEEYMDRKRGLEPWPRLPVAVDVFEEECVGV